MTIVPVGTKKVGKYTAILLCIVGFLLAGFFSTILAKADDMQSILADANSIIKNKANRVFKRNNSISYVLINKTNRKLEFGLIKRTMSKVKLKFEQSMLNGIVDNGAVFRSWKAGKLFQQPFNFVFIIGSKENAHELIQNFGMKSSLTWFLNRYDSFKMPCFAIPLTFYSEIKFNIIFIDQNIEDEFISVCLNEETIQSLGLFNDATHSKYFSFNDREIKKEITKYDICLLESLYDEDIKVGDPVKKVLKIFRYKLENGLC
jgi:predicted Zn-dependent protease with MMP-like domain